MCLEDSRTTHEEVVMQNLKLLSLASRRHPSLLPSSLRSSSSGQRGGVFRHFLQVLKQSDSSVRVCALECFEGLEREEDDDHELLECLLDLAQVESDPELLVEVIQK